MWMFPSGGGYFIIVTFIASVSQCVRVCMYVCMYVCICVLLYRSLFLRKSPAKKFQHVEMWFLTGLHLSKCNINCRHVFANHFSACLNLFLHQSPFYASWQTDALHTVVLVNAITYNFQFASQLSIVQLAYSLW